MPKPDISTKFSIGKLILRKHLAPNVNRLWCVVVAAVFRHSWCVRVVCCRAMQATHSTRFRCVDWHSLHVNPH